jgi:ABC-type lipoprotein export system ATPase subunit
MQSVWRVMNKEYGIMLMELDQIAKEYVAVDDGGPVSVLRDISLTVAEGDCLAIVGPSGSGKSTLLNIMGGLDVPSRGEVRLEGRNLADCSERELARVRNREIGFVFQLHHLLPQCGVLENVLLPAIPAGTAGDPATLVRARRLLTRVGLGERLNHRPGQLSGGECQRVAVVRALINGPRLLLADEPTGSLDADSSAALGRLLLELNREENIALVVVTHSRELARRMGRTLHLRQGTLHHDSVEAEIIAAP